MLHLDDRAAQVYADMHADLEAERVGHRLPVYRPGPSRLNRWVTRWQTFLRRKVAGLRKRLDERPAHNRRPQEQCC